MTRRGLTSLFALALVAPSVALAHPAVDEGRRFYEEAEFLEALDAFARAEGADDLTRDELISLFEIRALVHLAMGNEEPMREDLRRVVALAPDHVLDRRAPPDVRRVLAEVRSESRGPIRLRARPRAAAAGVSIEAEAENDPLSIVRHVRIRGRSSATWEEAIDGPLLVTLGEDSVVEYYAEAVGPGGVVVAASGSEDAPLRFSGDAAAEDEEEEGGDDGVLIGVLVGVGAALLVGGGVTVLVVVLGGDGASQQTNVAPFTVRF